MEYQAVRIGQLIDRPNRFIVNCLLDGEEVQAHCPNTGAMTGLIQKGGRVVLEPARNPRRKTKFSLRHVEKNGAWINIDSQAPNSLVYDFLTTHPDLLPEEGPLLLVPEQKYGSSRFDFYYEKGPRRGYIEVKGVTLEVDGHASFPDAPTVRGQKHVKELIQAQDQGYENLIFFCVQIPYAKDFRMNEDVDPILASLVHQAKEAGVGVLAYRCCVEPDRVQVTKELPVL